MALPEILYHGSVKDIRGSNQDSEPLLFEFSDRYSVFDWGEMPDNIPGKGNALAFLSWLFFDLLENAGIKTHMIGLIDDQGRLLERDEVFTKETNLMMVQKKKVIPPTVEQTKDGLVWNYTKYQEKILDALVPLEVIFRFAIPKGSSLLKRVDDVEYCKTLGLETPPKEGDIFETPVIEFSTKLENYDRYLSYDDAKKIAGLSDQEFKTLVELTTKTAVHLKKIFEQTGVSLLDGKFEYAFSDTLDENGERDFVLIDSIGPDELRLTFDGVQLSKQCLRDFYTGSQWEDAVDKAKTLADERGEENWKAICTDELQQTPPVLDPSLKETVSMLYTGVAKALVNTYYDRTYYYTEAWDLPIVAGMLKKWKEENGKA